MLVIAAAAAASMLHRYSHNLYIGPTSVPSPAAFAAAVACIDKRIYIHICCFAQHRRFDRFTSTTLPAIHVLFIFVYFFLFFIVSRIHFAEENLERFINALSRFSDKTYKIH